MKKIFEKDLSSGFFKLKFNPEQLDKLFDEQDFSLSDRASVKEIFNYLFQTNKAQDRRSIIHADKFDLYFDNALNSEGILFREFTPVLELPWEKIKERIDLWIAEKKEGYLLEILGNIDAFEGRDRFEKIAKILVTLVNLGIRSEFILVDWIKSLSENQVNIDRFYGVDKDFFKLIFTPSERVFLYDTYAIRLILRNYLNNKEFYFPLSKEKLQEISVSRLKQYIESRKEFDIRVFNIFYYNCWKEIGQGNSVILLDEANRLVKEYIDRYPFDYLRFTIRSKSTPHLDDEYVFEPFIPQYFGSWPNFEAFLNEKVKENSEFEEMIKYFDDFKRNTYAHFYSDKIPKWIEQDANGNSTTKYFKHQTYEAFIKEFQETKFSLS